MIVLLDDTHKHSVGRVGGKAANIGEMRRIGLPTPDGFVSTTDVTFGNLEPYSEFYYGLIANIRNLAARTNKTWGLDQGNPLLVSVRSGAPVSMPGMMDTILNVGLTRSNLDRFVSHRNGTKAFGLDCYRRLIQMFAVTVEGVDAEHFNEVYEAAKLFYDELDEEAYETIVNLYEEIYEKEVGEEFPQLPTEQLYRAAKAVYLSWFSKKAKDYRELEGISYNMGTAVTVQEMIFGNLDRSATGVVFTHNPNTGIKGLYGDFLKNAQGEDVVAGTHKVQSIEKLFLDDEISDSAKELRSALSRLFQSERDMLDVEFTIERDKLYLLQYRVAKRSKRASVRMLVDMTRDCTISSEEATKKFLDLLPKEIKAGAADESDLSYVGSGLGVTEGIAFGKIATNHREAQLYIDSNEDYIYVSKETSPSDSVYMKHSQGILTAKGGRLSHAAVVARGWNKPCVVCFEKMEVQQNGILVDGTIYPSGSKIKIDGTSGEVWL